MAFVKLNVSLHSEVVGDLRASAAEAGQPVSRYLAELIRADARRRRDELAAEGYRVLSEESRHFAADAFPLAAETWPEWDEEGVR